MNDLKIIVMVSIFIILLMVVFNAVKSAFNFNGFCCLIISICVSALAMIGMNDLLSGSMEVILLPYAAMAIAILVLLLFSFVGKYFKNTNGWFSRRTDKKNIQETKKND